MKIAEQAAYALVLTGFSLAAIAQPPGGAPPGGRGGFNMGPDPRVEQRTYQFEETTEELGYALFVSSEVSKDEPAPLIVALQGLGGDGNSLLRGCALELAELSELDVRNVMAMIRDEFTVDDDRTALMGHSMGGAGALFLGQKYADEWAAVAAIAPAAFMMQANSTGILQPMKDAGVPLLIIQGGADTVVPPENTRAWAESMEAIDMVGEYVEMPEGDHGTVINDGMPAIFELFEANMR